MHISILYLYNYEAGLIVSLLHSFNQNTCVCVSVFFFLSDGLMHVCPFASFLHSFKSLFVLDLTFCHLF